MEIIRATKTAEQAGAYYVRIQAMARKHQIPLDVEFDEHDTPQTKYSYCLNIAIRASALGLSKRQRRGPGNWASSWLK